jgi:uncharacterized membrane protein YkvI
MKKRWVIILQIAATYIGTVVGAGFASGKEIVEFFTVHGPMGMIGILVSGILFIWIGTKMMVLSHRIGAYSYEELNTYIFGEIAGRVINLLTLLILFGVTSVMLSGTGSIFEEQLGFSYQWGILITIVLCYVVMMKGLDGILAVNSLVVPMMICFSFLLITSLFENSGTSPLFRKEELQVSWKLFVSPFAYVAFNLAMAQAVLVPLGKEIEDESVLKWGGFWGGVGLCFMLLSCHFALYSLPNVSQFDIPIAEVIKSFGRSIHILFLIVVYGEIFTTLIGNVFGISRKMQKFFTLSERRIVLGILLLSFLISQVGFSSLLSFLYPLFGYIGLLMIFFVTLKQLPAK